MGAVMAESAWLVTVLSLLCFCSLALTVVMGAFFWQLRSSLRQLEAVTPDLMQLITESKEVFSKLSSVMQRADRATQRVESLVNKACDLAEDTVRHLEFVREGARTLLAKVRGNGAGRGSRHNHRRS